PPSTKEGRHPLPAPDEFQEALRWAGVNDDDRVVVYDDSGSTSAARAWWLLRWAGKENVSLLDGGLKAWIAEGEDLAVGPGNPVERGDFTCRRGHMQAVDISTVADWPDRGVLVDARAAERYEGLTEPVDTRAGHIPGAVNLPTTSFLADRGPRSASARRAPTRAAPVGTTRSCTAVPASTRAMRSWPWRSRASNRGACTRARGHSGRRTVSGPSRSGTSRGSPRQAGAPH